MQMLVCQPSQQVLKQVLLLLFAASCIGILIQLLSSRLEIIEERRFFSNYMMRINKGQSPFGSSVCNLPDFDPFDQTILKYIENFTLKCPNEPYLTIMDERGYIYLNKSGFKVANKSMDSVHCYYFSVEGVEGEENELKYGERRNVTVQPTQTGAEFVSVACQESKKTLYQKVHFTVPRPDKKLKRKNLRAQKKGRPSVLLLHIDSMSRLNVMRNLPKTYEYLTKQLGSVIMRGMNKIGLNTHPNMLALLTGYKVNPDAPGVGTPYHKKTDGYFDELPLVWRNFSRAGYATMWMDEMASEGLFYFAKGQGFRHRQTDYFPRPLMHQMESLGLKSVLGDTVLCFGNTPTYSFILDYIDRFIKSMKNTIYFAFTSIIRISHDNLNSPQAMDFHLYDLVKRMYDRGDLNNTVLIIFGDHGLRFGKSRQTLIGDVEDKMPFMSIYLPQRLRDEKPHLQSSLELNSGRLLSWFDMHEMLLDLATDDLEEISWRGPSVVGMSPLRPLPENRSCEDAGIPTNFCVCMTPVDVDVEDAVVVEAARHVVDHVNALLRSLPDKPCAELILQQIESAQVIKHAQNVMVDNGFIEFLRVSVRTLPSNAVFQALYERHAKDQIGKVYGDVERINRYGNQSWCVMSDSDPRIKMYCLCKSDGS